MITELTGSNKLHKSWIILFVCITLVNSPNKHMSNMEILGSHHLPRILEEASIRWERDRNSPNKLHPTSQRACSLPVWNLSPCKHQLSKQNSSGSYYVLGIENKTKKKGIVTQLAPEEFTLEDVQHLQKRIRELHSENMQKTVSYIKLEHAYHSLKDDIAALKQENSNSKNKGAEAHSQYSTIEGSNLPEREELVKELKQLREKYDLQQAEEAHLRRLVNYCEERFDCFNQIVNDSSRILAENKELLDTTTRKVQLLESELVEWKTRSKEYEKLLMDQINICSPDRGQTVDPDLYSRDPRSSSIKIRPVKPLRSSRTPDDSIVSSSSRVEPSDQSVTGSSIYRYLAPKANSCFSCVKAALCRCPTVPLQDSDSNGSVHVKK